MIEKTTPDGCPCCFLPTIWYRGGHEICGVCHWHDDGQDDPDADEVWGGPNYQYSLTAARANFRDHYHKYDLGTGPDHIKNPSPERLALIDYVKVVLSGKMELDPAKLLELEKATIKISDADRAELEQYQRELKAQVARECKA